MDDQQQIEALKSERLRDAVKINALQQGLLDPSDLNQIPLDNVGFKEDGSITGVTEFVQNLKTSKSHWFRKDNQSPTHDRAGRPIPKMPDVSQIKPGSPEAKKIEADFMQRHMR